MKARQFKDAVYAELARIGKALASGPRLELLDLLCQGPRPVEALARQIGQSVANTSHHLQVLRRARLVDADRDGVRVIYRVADEQVSLLFLALRQLGDARLLEIQDVTRRFLEERGSMEAVDRDSLVEKIERGEVTVIDVRPPEEYQAGHLPGAVSIPLPELAQRLTSLPRRRQIVAYCRGPYCVMALEAVELLRARGYKAVRLDEGVADWRARGRTIELPSPEVCS